MPKLPRVSGAERQPSGSTMREPVYLSELLDALEWVSAGVPFENAAYVSRETGRIYWDTDAADEDLPEDLEDGTVYVRVPHKHDLELGQKSVFRFVEASLPDAYEQVRGYFSRRGAYARFKDLLDRRGLLEAWYSYEQEACESELRAWAEAQGLQVVEGRRADG